MQKVAAYLLERRNGMAQREARAIATALVKSTIQQWLASKGAVACGNSGTYRPEDGSVGTFETEEAVDGDRSWWMLRLHEDTAEGRRFTAIASVTSVDDRVSVYVTLETGWMTSRILPVSVNPHCPRLVRNLLQLPGEWYHGASMLRPRESLRGFAAGEALIEAIERLDRTIPYVLVSTRDGVLTLPELDRRLEYDLAGLANVVTLDDEASWALSDILGPEWCCYWGAVRLFWPHFVVDQDRYRHPLWTAERLRSQNGDVTKTRERFCRQLRRLVFDAAALSVIRPREIDRIRDAARLRSVNELRERAASLGEFQELADSYAHENDRFREERESLLLAFEAREARIANLEGRCHALEAHLLAAGAVHAPVEASADIVPCGEQGDTEDAEPVPGEVRFYKKVYARQTHDVLVRVKDCGCNRWQASHGADKARKGIMKLEKGRSDWQSMRHCGSCTGGGMWRVQW